MPHHYFISYTWVRSSFWVSESGVGRLSLITDEPITTIERISKIENELKSLYSEKSTVVVTGWQRFEPREAAAAVEASAVSTLQSEPSNDQRAIRAADALDGYKRLLGEAGAVSSEDVSDLLSDLMHLCAARGWFFYDAVASARMNFEAEIVPD